MLLLVLILVLIAFGLLVVALLSSSVLWAWVSVGVSVVAAAVLLFDWMQRRSAVKAGSEPAAEPARPGGTVTDIEPVTEVLAVVPRAGAPTPGQEPPVGPARGEPTDAPAAPPSHFDGGANGQQTVVMPAVQPPGSPVRPSGAGHDSPPSGGPSLLSVTKSGSDRPAEPAHGGSGPAAADPDDTVLAAAPPGAERRRGEPGGPGGHDATVAVDRSALTASVPTESAGAAGEETVVAVPPLAAAKDDDAASVAGEPDEPAAAETAGEPAADAEAPEEAHDAAAAAVVAGLDDEVVVVDEHPRYHLVGCRALAVAPPIPLPVREAIELGFTPCGWCSPDRTLAGRHQAAAR